MTKVAEKIREVLERRRYRSMDYSNDHKIKATHGRILDGREHNAFPWDDRAGGGYSK